MNALITTSMPLTYADIERLGASIAKSGLFGIKTPEQAIALMMIAQAEGRHPALAARDYDVIAGRPSKKAEAMLRDFLEAGGKVEWHALNDEKAEATFHHPQGGKVRIGWDMKRAEKAGLGGKDMWKKFPRQMLRSRTISEGVRTVWPLATSGLYEPGEVADFSGPTIDAEPQPKSERDSFNAATPMDQPLKRETLREWMTRFEVETTAAQTPEEASRVLDPAMAMEEFLSSRPAAKAQYDAIRQACIARVWAEPPEDDDEDAPEIVGQEKILAG